MMMIFTSIYGVVDGFFVSNYVGKTPFAAKYGTVQQAWPQTGGSFRESIAARGA